MNLVFVWWAFKAGGSSDATDRNVENEILNTKVGFLFEMHRLKPEKKDSDQAPK